MDLVFYLEKAFEIYRSGVEKNDKIEINKAISYWEKALLLDPNNVTAIVGIKSAKDYLKKLEETESSKPIKLGGGEHQKKISNNETEDNTTNLIVKKCLLATQPSKDSFTVTYPFLAEEKLKGPIKSIEINKEDNFNIVFSNDFITKDEENLNAVKIEHKELKNWKMNEKKSLDQTPKVKIKHKSSPLKTYLKEEKERKRLQEEKRIKIMLIIMSIILCSFFSFMYFNPGSLKEMLGTIIKSLGEIIYNIGYEMEKIYKNLIS